MEQLIKYIGMLRQQRDLVSPSSDRLPQHSIFGKTMMPWSSRERSPKWTPRASPFSVMGDDMDGKVWKRILECSPCEGSRRDGVEFNRSIQLSPTGSMPIALKRAPGMASSLSS